MEGGPYVIGANEGPKVDHLIPGGRRVLWIRAEAPRNPPGEDILRRNGYALQLATASVEEDPSVDLATADIILLEFSHGEASGLTFCRKLTEAHDGPLVVIAPRLGILERVAFLEFGADSVLLNNIHPIELLAVVRSVDRRAMRARPSQPSRETEWRFEVVTGNVISDRGRLVQLTRGDTELLFALAVRAGRLVDRQTLLRELHGSTEPAKARSVDARIARLRQALAACEIGTIRTVRGRGYVWEPARFFKVVDGAP